MQEAKNANKFMLILFLIHTLGSIVYSYLIDFYQFPLNIYYNILIPQVVFTLIPMIIYLIVTKSKIKNIFRLRQITLYEFFTIILFSFFILPLIYFINALSMLFAKNHIADMATSIIDIPMIYAFGLMALLPAINEELLTRGILYHSYRKSGILKAALLSSLFFGMLHMNINQFMYAFFLGFIFVMLVEATNSIFSAILAHLVINGVNVFLMFSSSQDKVPMAMTNDVMVYIIIFIFIILLITLPIALFIYYCLVKYNDRVDHIKSIFRTPNHSDQDNDMPELQYMSDNSSKKIVTLPVYICIFIFISFSLLIEFL
jgi:hypothetical protein